MGVERKGRKGTGRRKRRWEGSWNRAADWLRPALAIVSPKLPKNASLTKRIAPNFFIFLCRTLLDLGEAFSGQRPFNFHGSGAGPLRATAGPGADRGRKRLLLCTFDVSHLEHPFQYFERWRGPQTSRGPGKLPLPLSTGLGVPPRAVSPPSKTNSRLYVRAGLRQTC